jgi:SPP1 gp7 family putative phage head morphogenesis protein
MGITDWFKSKEVVEDYIPSVGVNEQFKGEVETKKIKFPEELGEEHPFDFEICEGLLKKDGLISAVVDKYVDFVVGPGFYVTSKDEKAQKIIEDFNHDVNMDTLLRVWVRDALAKGNSDLELGGGEKEAIQGMKILNSNYMYINRNDLGELQGFKQYKGAFKKYDKEKVVEFKPYEIAHLSLNKIGDCAYGYGIVYPALCTLNNLLKNEKDSHMLMSRKANSPYHIKLGGVIGGKYYKPNPSDVSKIGKELEYQTNKLEWTTDGLTDIKVIDFGAIGDKFDGILRYDLEKLFYIFQIPAVIMGMANVSEGIAKVQIDVFERKIQSIQAEVEKIIENQIYKRVLQSNGMDVHVEFEWGQPSETQNMERLAKLQTLMSGLRVSDSLYKLMEKDVVKLLGYDEDEYEVMSKEEERRREEERSQALVPGQNENKPKFPIPKKEVKRERYELKEDCKHCEESLGNINDIQEWLGFNYKDYIKQISAFIKQDSFTNVKAENAIEEKAGYLSPTQINELKRVLNNGITKGKSIREIARDIDVKVQPSDLYEITDTGEIGRLVRGKEVRSVGIARTEITRVSNEGAIKQFADNGVTKIRWVASSGNRTCEQCEALNGMIYETYNHPEIPLHPYCRCTVTAVTELN